MPNSLPIARLLAHLDLHSRHGGGGGAIFLKQYEQRINDPLHRKEKQYHVIFLVLLQLYFHNGTRSQKVNNKLSINLLTPSIIEPTASRPMPNQLTRLTDNKFLISLLTPSRISLDEEILLREATLGAPFAKKTIWPLPKV